MPGPICPVSGCAVLAHPRWFQPVAARIVPRRVRCFGLTIGDHQIGAHGRQRHEKAPASEKGCEGASLTNRQNSGRLLARSSSQARDKPDITIWKDVHRAITCTKGVCCPHGASCRRDACRSVVLHSAKRRHRGAALGLDAQIVLNVLYPGNPINAVFSGALGLTRRHLAVQRNLAFGN